MTRIRRLAVATAVSMLLASCAQTNYRPVVDFKSSTKTAATYEADLRDCQQLAAQRDPGVDAVGGAAAGAALGMLVGAAINHFTGGVGSIGSLGAAGAVGGGLGAGGSGVKNQHDIIINCLGGRGYDVVGR